MKRSVLFLVAIATVTTISVADEARDDAIVVRAIQRMQGYDFSSNEKVMAAIGRHIDRSEGTPEYLELIKQFQPDGMLEKLDSVMFGDNSSAAVEAVKVVCELKDGPRHLRELLRQKDSVRSANLANVMGLLGNGRTTSILLNQVTDEKVPYDLRRAAVAGLAKSRGGEAALLRSAESKKLVGDTRLLAGALLARAKDPKVKEKAATELPQPAMKDQKPLAPLDKLASMKGDSVNGLKLFRGVGTCANCHVVKDHGKEVGPNLSEIGSKLSREAMLTSILDPSAGISHNYENYKVLTDSGQVITGIKVSETDSEVVIRTADAIDRKVSKDEIELLRKSEKSIMPDRLHHTFGQKGLIDIVEYMMTLKKKS